MSPDDKRIENELKRRTRFARLQHVACCDSTQDLAIAADTDTPATSGDAVFWADHQLVGRGRQQREWHDESGLDLAVTFRATLRIAQPVALPAALPVAVLQACEAFAGRPLRIKWPNDVFAGDRKLSGVLIDRDSRWPDTYRIGIGINVNRAQFAGELQDIATSLAVLTGQPHDRAALLLELATHVDAMLTALQNEQLQSYEQLFAQRLGLLDQVVDVTAGEIVRGTLTAIDFERLTLDGTRHVPLAITTAMKLVRE